MSPSVEVHKVDPSDLPGVWSEVIRAAGNSPGILSMGKAMIIEQIDQRVVTLTHKPGNRSYVTERQKTQVAEILGKVLGFPVSVQIQQKQASTDDDQGAGSPDTNGVMSQRQLAMKLPLVEQISELFDVSLVEVADDQSQFPPTDDTGMDDEMSDDYQEEDDV